MSEPLVSIIVPIYNAEQFLKKAITSLLKQSYKNIEILLVDDGSTDSSPILCDEFASMDHRIKVIHKTNGGVSSARNAGLSVASGDFISFVDSDDYVSENYLMNLVTKANEYPGYVIKCGFSHEYSDGTPVEKEEYGDSGLVLCNQAFDITNKYDYSTVYGKLFPVDVIKRGNEIAGFNEAIHYGEDYLFCIEKIIMTGGMYILTDRDYHYVFHDGSAIQTFNRKRFTVLYALQNIEQLVHSYPISLRSIRLQTAEGAFWLLQRAVQCPEVLTKDDLSYVRSTMIKYSRFMLCSKNSVKVKIAYLIALLSRKIYGRLF